MPAPPVCLFEEALAAVFIKVNGCNHYVEDLGPKDAPAILTFHGGGGMGSSGAKKRAFGALTDTYRVVVYDLRGCGQSEEVGEPSYEQWAADAEALRQELGLGKVVVAGGSAGGYLVLEYALRYPDSVAALILRDTGAVRITTDALKERAAKSGRPIDWERFQRYWTGHCTDNDDMAQAFWDVMPLYPGKSGWDPVKGRESWGNIRWHVSTHNYMFTHNYKGWDVRPRLHEIQVPALVVHGDLDWVVPIERGIELAEGLPQGRLEVFEGCGHQPHNEENGKFVTLVREFLQRELD